MSIKHACRTHVVLAFVTIISACSNVSPDTPTAAIPLPDIRAQALLWKNEGVVAGWSYDNAGNYPYAITESSLRVRSGSTSLRMEIRSGERDSGGLYHAELVKRGVGKRGQTRWYGLSTFLISDSYSQGLTTTQWFNKTTGRPSIMLFPRIGQNEWGMNIKWDRTETGQVYRFFGTLQKNAWTDWVFQIKWSSGSDGFIKAWQNGTYLGTIHSGPNTYANEDDLDLHVGAYGAGTTWLTSPPSVQETRVVYHDAVRIGDSASTYDEVRPR